MAQAIVTFTWKDLESRKEEEKDAGRVLFFGPATDLPLKLSSAETAISIAVAFPGSAFSLRQDPRP
jgi:hypothetical protein